MPEQPQSPFSAISQHAESLGGGVMGGLGSILSSIGLPGMQKRVADWGQSPANRRLVGGGTAVLGTLLTALAARKLLGGGGRRQPDYEPMFVEAGVDPFVVGFRVGLVKQGYPDTMGTPIKPLKPNGPKTATPRRWGIHGSHRQRTHDKLKQKALSSSSALGR